ncbi:MAG: MBL fold metallo-hydrolase [Candidatus Lokiarchaeota archaeon]|nr:MBL fold metallo-hydrolase [Candidatus Lokiarchaeota archaeon]
MFFQSGSRKKKGIEVLSNVYYFPEFEGQLDCNIYCIIDENKEEIALFDIGNGISLNGLFEGLKDLGFNPENISKVFITHEHVDHVLGLYKLLELRKNNPPKIFAYGETTKILKTSDEKQMFPDTLGIKASMFGIKLVPLEIIDITEQKQITIFPGFDFQIHYTPGHSLGSICYYDSSNKILIPGDVVFTQGSFGRFDFPGGSFEQLQNSIKFLTELDVTYLLPGHMNPSKNGNRDIKLSYSIIKNYESFF